MRPFFLFRLRASADLSLAFWPGGIKNACFFASLIISSVITLRLKRRNALSIDSPWLIVTMAIRFPSFFVNVSSLPRYLTRLKHSWSSTPECRSASPNSFLFSFTQQTPRTKVARGVIATSRAGLNQRRFRNLLLLAAEALNLNRLV